MLGAIIMGAGGKSMKKEYALSIGIVLLMFGIYGSSQTWNIPGTKDETENDA